MDTAECPNGDPLRALCDAVVSHASTTYAIESAVQGAFCEDNGVAWYTGRVVGNVDGCAIMVRFDEDGIEETYVLPEDGAELKSMPPVSTGDSDSGPEGESASGSREGEWDSHAEEDGSDGNEWGAEQTAKRRRRDTDGSRSCPHGRRKRLCKECGGAGICPHRRQKHTCKEWGGANICPHGRQKHTCKECGRAGICAHGRQKRVCKECGGAGICPHGRRKRRCKECGGKEAPKNTSRRRKNTSAHGRCEASGKSRER